MAAMSLVCLISAVFHISGQLNHGFMFTKKSMCCIRISGIARLLQMSCFYFAPLLFTERQARS